MTDTATLQAWLDEAEDARRAILLGTSAVAVMHKGKSVTFRKADMGQLNDYIIQLKRDLGLPGGERQPPMKVYFR